MTHSPPEKYIKRNVTVVTLTLRIDQDVKNQAESMSKSLGTSLNRLSEAALRWYMAELNKIENEFTQIL